MANDIVVNQNLSMGKDQTVEDIITRLLSLNHPDAADAADEIERLRAAVHRVFSAIEDEGRNPEYHRRIMREHRRQWPTLWNALDMLNKEARRG